MKKLIIGNTNEDFCFFKLQLSLEIIGQEEEEGKACYKFELFWSQNGLVLSHILIDLA